MERAYISKGQFVKTEEFLERLCQSYHLDNYYGAIIMAVENVMEFIDDDIFFEFDKCNDGVRLSVSAENNFVFGEKIIKDKDNLDNPLFAAVLLADDVSISKNGRTIEMIFFVDGVEDEILISRQSKVKTYCNKQLVVNNK